MLTDSQIEELSKKMGFKLEGCFFKDELPKKLKYNTAYVINIQSSEDEDGNPNEGTHWTCFQVNKYKDNSIEPIYFDSYGSPPPESVKKFVKENCNKILPYNTKDIQSLMNEACGWYCCAFLHFINAFEQRSRDLYSDVEGFLDLFDDLNKSIDFKKNEYILRLFFQSKDKSLRKDIDLNNIVNDDQGTGLDMMKIPVNVNIKN